MKPYPLMTHPIGLAARRVARKLGIVKLISPLLKSRVYEEAFSDALLAEIRAGDCAWDVGANVGLYTTLLAERAGPSGKVVAFEPSPRSFEKLRAACQAPGIVLMQCALGPKKDTLPFDLSEDETGVTDKIAIDPGSTSRKRIHVDVLRADDVVSQRPALAPNVIKIDVEGFEVDVLAGMDEVLRSPSLRALFIEVHFSVLEARGRHDAPRQIENQLKAAGYTTEWLDHSHVVARRIAGG